LTGNIDALKNLTKLYFLNLGADKSASINLSGDLYVLNGFLKLESLFLPAKNSNLFGTIAAKNLKDLHSLPSNRNHDFLDSQSYNNNSK
jgi:hypothetical protein